jgi:hypothetical protein
MKNIIKKILREEFDWIDEIPSESIVVTKENVYVGAKVKLRESSIYYGTHDIDNLGDYVGTIHQDPQEDDLVIYNQSDNNNWVYVEWVDDLDNIKFNYYRLGPNYFDLEFTFE